MQTEEEEGRSPVTVTRANPTRCVQVSPIARDRSSVSDRPSPEAGGVLSRPRVTLPRKRVVTTPRSLNHEIVTARRWRPFFCPAATPDKAALSRRHVSHVGAAGQPVSPPLWLQLDVAFVTRSRKSVVVGRAEGDLAPGRFDLRNCRR
ncbi:hypothetical protein MTO96_002918 [Rhipicephalus appendiculatus]